MIPTSEPHVTGHRLAVSGSAAQTFRVGLQAQISDIATYTRQAVVVLSRTEGWGEFWRGRGKGRERQGWMKRESKRGEEERVGRRERRDWDWVEERASDKKEGRRDGRRGCGEEREEVKEERECE